jgi:hypothetical protein
LFHPILLSFTFTIDLAPPFARYFLGHPELRIGNSTSKDGDGNNKEFLWVKECTNDAATLGYFTIRHGFPYIEVLVSRVFNANTSEYLLGFKGGSPCWY